MGVTTEVDRDGYENITSYNPKPLFGFGVLFYYRGSCLLDKKIVREILIAVIITLVACWWLLAYSPTFESAGHVGDFLSALGGTLALMIGFFTGGAVGGREKLADPGCGNVGAGMIQLCEQIQLFTTLDQAVKNKVMDAVRRYSNAAHYMIFSQSRIGGPGIDQCVSHGLLTSEEAKELKKVSGNPAETIWCWMNAVVAGIWKQGKLVKPYHMKMLGGKAEMGRKAVEMINGHLANPPPTKFAILLSILIKLYLIFYCVDLGFKMANKVEAGQTLAAGLCILQVLFNIGLLVSMYILALELDNPFNGDLSDLSMDSYIEGAASDQKEFHYMITHPPASLMKLPFKTLSKKA